jgi:multidrug efflux system membrane fusion protein
MKRGRTRLQAQWGLWLASLIFGCPLYAQDYQGTSEWGNSVILSTTVSGMVTKVHISVGDEVVQGAVLLELDQRGYQRRLAAAEARHEASKQQNEEARRELDRTLELYNRTLISDHERKLAEIDVAKADAELREAEAELTVIRLQQDYSRINAPFSGRVVALHVQPGQAVANRIEVTPLMTLVDHNQMLAQTQIDERALSSLTLGKQVKIGIRGVWLDGIISALGYEPVNRSEAGARYLLEAQFKPQEGMELRSGEKLVIRLSDE